MLKLHSRHIATIVLIASLSVVAFAATANASTKLSFRLVRNPAVTTSSTRAVFQMARNVAFGVESQECRVDNQPWQICREWVGLDHLRAGTHVFQGKLTMVNGRSAGFTFRWTISNSPAPSVPVVRGGTPGWVHSSQRTVSHSTASLLTYHRRVSTNQGRTWVTSRSGGSLTVTREGETWVEYSAGNAAGTTSAWSAPAKVKLDHTSPTTPATPTLANYSGGWTTGHVTVVVHFNSTDAHGINPNGYQYSISYDDGNTWQTHAISPRGDGKFVITRDGETLIIVRSHDVAGNPSAWTPMQTIELDNTPPRMPDITGGGPQWLSTLNFLPNGSRVYIDSSGDYAGFDHTDYQTNVNGAGWVAGGTIQQQRSAEVDLNNNGTTLVRARTCDVLRNCSGWTTPDDNATINLDGDFPTMPVVTGGNGPGDCSSDTVTLSVSSTDATSGIAEFRYFVYGGSDNVVSSGSVDADANGTADLTVSASDFAGDSSFDGHAYVEFIADDPAGNFTQRPNDNSTNVCLSGN